MAMKLTETSAIRAFLETDRLYAGYAIGDLEPGLFEQCEWYGLGGGSLEALVLVFHGFRPPVLFLMGDEDVLAQFLPDVEIPAEVYLNCRREHLEVAGSLCAWSELAAMWRMALRVDSPGTEPAGCVPLGPEDAGRLAELYASGGGEAFRPAQMERGVYCGIVKDGRLVAAAGTHVVSDTFGVAAMGNVFTHPSWRGRGLGEAVTRAVVARLARRGVRDIILNVSQRNRVAVDLYRRIGFLPHCAFLEGGARRLANPPNWP
jgi:ribosomal protein S18 acetylase RimI-like enzyme